MNAVLGILRATFRLKGSLIWWLFYFTLFGFAVLMLQFAPGLKSDKVAMLIGSTGAWMGWCLFLPRLWQLQRHAESLHLPGARRHHRQAVLLLGAVGCLLPSCVLAWCGAPFVGVLAYQVSAVATALLYLLMTPLVGAALLSAVFLAGYFSDRWLPVQQITDAQWQSIVLVLALLALWLGAKLWRRHMVTQHGSGWSTPQIVAMTGSAFADSADGAKDLTAHWVSARNVALDRQLGPHTPVRSLALLLCGPLAPLGLRNYLGSMLWMMAPVVFLAVMAVRADSGSRGPLAALTMLMMFWSLGVPLTIVTRLRKEWHEGGQALCEVALLPGLNRGDRPWLPAMLAVAGTALYRLWLPSLAIVGVLMYTGDVIDSGLGPWMIAWWGGALMILLLPIAQREGAVSTAVLFGLSGLVVIGVLLRLRYFYQHGMIGAPWSTWVISATVVAASWLAMRWPRPNRAFELC